MEKVQVVISWAGTSGNSTFLYDLVESGSCRVSQICFRRLSFFLIMYIKQTNYSGLPHRHAQDWSLLHAAGTAFRHLHAQTHPPSLAPTGPWSITQPDSELGIDKIDKLINKKSKSLSNVIEAFLRNPEPPSWIPPG